MAKFKDFGKIGDQPREPITFKLYDEEFSCRQAIQGKILLEMVAKSSDPDDPGAAAKVITDFFAAVLMPESFARFNILTSDPEKIIDVESLAVIINWLVEQYADRPTPRSEISSSGQ